MERKIVEPMKKVLVVEDEPILGLEIVEILEQLGYNVTGQVTNFNDAIRSVLDEEPDIVFMDINIEGEKDGIEAATTIKTINKKIGLVYLTAYCDEETVFRAKRTDPCNYLNKPFSRESIQSSIALSLYKRNHEDENSITYPYTSIGHNFYYDLDNDNLFFKTQPIPLGKNEKIFLRLLIEAKGQLVDFRSIEYAVWPDSPVGSTALRTLVSRLRQKLEYKLIKAVPSFGYQLSKDVT
jgi:DNA-binding response OmpR family regulator